MTGHRQRSGAWVEDSRRTPDSTSLFSTVSFLPHTLSLAAFWASKAAKDGFLSVPQWTDSACLVLPLQSHCSACWSPQCLPGEARGRRSGGGWGHSCSSPELHFLPSPGPLGQGSPGRKARVATSQRSTQSSLLQPLSHLALRASTSWIFIWHHS